jgi:hypothetical protein
MAKRNGGIIGKVNTPTVSTAKGVWRLQDQYNARKNNILARATSSSRIFSHSWWRSMVDLVLIISQLQAVELVVTELLQII